MLSIPFINRTNDLKFLTNYKKEVGHGNHAVFITAKSGIGKSKLTGKFVADCLTEEIPSVKVEINQRKNDNYDSGYYIRRIGKSINAISKISKIESISSFCRKFHSKTLNTRLAEAIKSDFIELLPVGKKTAEEISSRLFGSDNYDDDILFESAHAEILSLLQDYLKEQFKKTSVILNIENIQSIDDYSLTALQSIIRESAGSVFIFEYTDDDKDCLELGYIIAKLDVPDERVIIYELPPIEMSEIIDGLQQFPELGMQILNKSYTNWDGNLRPLTDILVKLKYSQGSIAQNLITISNATRINIEALNTSELFILTLIFVHQEPVPINFLNYLNNFNQAFKLVVDIDGSVNMLLNRELLKRTNDGLQVELAHDTIANIIAKSETSARFIVIAQKFWFSLYDKEANTEIQIARSIRLFRTLYFASLLNYDSKIYTVINDIARHAIKTTAPKQILIYLLKINEKIKAASFDDQQGERLKKISKLIIEIFYNIGLYAEAFNLISETRDLDKNLTALKSVLLIENAQHKQAYDLASSFTNEQPGYKTLMAVVMILALFGMNETEKCKDLFNEYTKQTEIKNTFEYGFLLRTSELFCSTNETINFLKESIDHFKKYGGKIQAAYSQNNYAVHLAISGRLDTAKVEADDAAKQLTDVSIERHTIFNNIACIMLSENKLNDEVEILLRQALITAELDSEKLAIYSNYLVLTDLRDEDEFAFKLISDVEALVKRSSYLDEGILLIAYYDIYLFYKKVSQIPLANKYYNKCIQLHDGDDRLWEYRLKNAPISENDECYFSAHLPRAINFLCHWNIEFDSKLMNYQ